MSVNVNVPHGNCEECEQLSRKHNCRKYHKRLAGWSWGGGGILGSYHERCSECDKDYYIEELERKIKEKQHEM